MPARMLSRSAGCATRRRNSASPPAIAQLGTSTPMPVCVAVYGYWSIITSVPAARALSTMASVRTLCPHIACPTALWCVSTTGMRARRPISSASPTPSSRPMPSLRRCDV